MPKFFPAVVAITLLLAACSTPMPDSFAVRDVRLFDGDRVYETMTVLVANGSIAAVGAHLDLPSRLTIVEGRGRTLLPGFIDGHTHAFGNALSDALRFGVTTELDMFTEHRWAAEMRKEQQNGRAQGRADLFSAGTLVTAPGGHGTEYGIAIPTLAGPDQAQDFVDARLSEGSDYIKIVYDDGSAYGLTVPSIDESTLRAVIQAAHSRGALAIVHISTKLAALDAITAGADGLMHIFSDEAIDDELIQAVVDGGAFVVPTLSVVAGIFDETGRSMVADDEALSPLLSPEQRRTLQTRFPFSKAEPSSFDIAKDAVIRLHNAGVAILAGTDAPNPRTAHGASLHREMELLVATGLSPLFALQSATSAPADAFHLQDRGRINTGLKADLVLVDGDPTTDIRATRKIVSIWKDGVEVDRGTPAEENAGSSLPRLESGVTSTFDDGTLKATSGSGWVPSTDDMMGGSSTVALEIIGRVGDVENRCLTVRGTIVAGVAFPWAGAILYPGEQPMLPVDATQVSRLTFDARGEGVLRVMVFAESLGWIPAEQQIVLRPSWQRYEIPFEAFTGVDREGLKAVLFSGGPDAGSFEFAIDEVGFDEG